MIALSALDPPGLIREASALLAAAGIDTARLDARILVGAVTGLDASDVTLATGYRLSSGQRRSLGRLLARRLAHEPVSRILGKREFWSLEFRLSPSTLDPRPDSETLVAAILADLDRRAIARHLPLSLLDLGTGTGCLSLALLSELPQARAIAVDRVEQAAQTARQNAASLGFSARFHVAVGDWGRAVQGPFDLILSNPPYIPTKELPALPLAVGYDPPLALDGGADGLAAYRQICIDAYDQLKPQGTVAFEVGFDQAAKVGDLLRQNGFCVMPAIRDLAQLERVVLAHRI